MTSQFMPPGPRSDARGKKRAKHSCTALRAYAAHCDVLSVTALQPPLSSASSLMLISSSLRSVFDMVSSASRHGPRAITVSCCVAAGRTGCRRQLRSRARAATHKERVVDMLAQDVHPPRCAGAV